MKKLTNEQKIDLILKDLQNWADSGGSDSDDSLLYALNNNYRYHAANLWLGTGAASEDVLKLVEDVRIPRSKENKEIKQICEEAHIYICAGCNHHGFHDDDQGETISCFSCGETATKQQPKTKVVFRVFPKGDVIALFPEEIADPHNNIMSYQKIGQHGAASPKLIKELKRAQPKDYLPLKTELEKIGYNLEVIK